MHYQHKSITCDSFTEMQEIFQGMCIFLATGFLQILSEKRENAKITIIRTEWGERERENIKVMIHFNCAIKTYFGNQS